MSSALALLQALALCLVPAMSAASVAVTEGTNISVDVSDDGRIVFDLLGGLWLLDATPLAQPVRLGRNNIREPRFSADGNRIVFTADEAGVSQAYLHELGSDGSKRLSDGRSQDSDAAWHPDGERIVVASRTADGGSDLYEIDIATGLRWRLTDLDGDESDPAWSADGRDLVYVHERDDRWTLMLRRFGEPDSVLVESEQRLSSPSWRPDGSLISYLKFEDEVHIHMLILSDPLLDRELVSDDDVFDAPIAWRDRYTLYYAANGSIRRREFDSWIARDVPFRAVLGEATGRTARTGTRPLPVIDPPSKRWVLRAARVFDGSVLRDTSDIIIDGGRIAAIEAPSERDAMTVIDLGDATAIPGLIDLYAHLPDTPSPTLGPLLLSLGVTTVVARTDDAESLNAQWSGEAMPGPRILELDDTVTDQARLLEVSAATPASVTESAKRQGIPVLARDWQSSLAAGADLLLAPRGLPRSPGGRRYQDVQLANGAGRFFFVSGLAHANTPGIESILSMRQVPLMSGSGRLRPAVAVDALPAAANAVVGSRPNGLPAGLGTQAELVALAASGLPAADVLKAGTARAAEALGIDDQSGRLEAGQLADIVLVAGNPAVTPESLSAVIGVVRNGRFFSAVGLIDRAR